MFPFAQYRQEGPCRAPDDVLGNPFCFRRGAYLAAFRRRRLLGNLEDSVILPHLSVAKEVRDKLGLPLWLAAKYTAILFLLHVRFHVSDDGVLWQRFPSAWEHRWVYPSTPGFCVFSSVFKAWASTALY